MRLSIFKRLTLIACGYLGAVTLGCLAVWLKNLTIPQAVLDASSGMYAFGDAILFLGVCCVGAIIPTLFLFAMVNRTSPWWQPLGFASIGVATTGFLFSVLTLLPAAQAEGMLHGLQTIGILRMLVSPLFFLSYVPGLLLAQSPRKFKFLMAFLIEGTAVFIFLVGLLLCH